MTTYRAYQIKEEDAKDTDLHGRWCVLGEDSTHYIRSAGGGLTLRTQSLPYYLLGCKTYKTKRSAQKYVDLKNNGEQND